MAPKVRRIRIVQGVAYPMEFGVQQETQRETSPLPVPMENKEPILNLESRVDA